MANFQILNSSNTEISYLDLGTITPGNVPTATQIKVKNVTTATVNTVTAAFWPGIQNNMVSNTLNFPVTYARVIRQDSNGNNMVTAVAKEDVLGALTARTSRDVVYLYDGASYTDYSAGNVSFMNGASHKIYIGADEIYRNILFNFVTPGSYTGLTYKYWNGSAWTALPVDYSDGTSGLTANGVLFLGTLTPALWAKTTINSKKMYWIQISCSAVATQAVADQLYWTYVWDFPKSCIAGTVSYYVESADATPVYTPYASAVYEYLNIGRIVCNTNPLGAGESLTATYSYKIPQPGTYALTFPSAVNKCKVNAGSDIGILANGIQPHYDVIGGMVIIFNSELAVGDTATIEISDEMKYIWYSTDNTTFYNKDTSIGNIAANASTSVYIRNCPPQNVGTSKNTQGMNLFFYGTS